MLIKKQRMNREDRWANNYHSFGQTSWNICKKICEGRWIYALSCIFITPREPFLLLCALSLLLVLPGFKSFASIWACLNPGNSSDSSTNGFFVLRRQTDLYTVGDIKLQSEVHRDIKPLSMKLCKREGPHKHHCMCADARMGPKPEFVTYFFKVEFGHHGDKSSTALWSAQLRMTCPYGESMTEGENRCFDERAVNCKSIRAAGVMNIVWIDR